MSLKIDKEELNVKNKIVDEAIVQLKKEFVGIDEQIDTIMKNVRVWFLYPQLQSSPCVINIFGMTGCGKTSLVRRIAQLLNVEKNLVYFNFCAINEMSSWDVEQDIEEQLDNECSNRIFVYDEFQYANVIDSDGEEKDNKNGLKPFWELLDTGILHKRNQFWEIREIAKIVMAMLKINAACPMNIENGVWTNAEECLSSFNGYDRKQFDQLFSYPLKVANEENSGKKLNGRNLFSEEESCDVDFFLRDYLKRLTKFYCKSFNKVCEESDMYIMLSKMNAEEICEFIGNIYECAQKGYDLKFNESLIFVIANLDEAYNVAFDVNPDMSPDQFHKITKKISIVDIKKALQKRFRNEQIARLGNIHVIYPSFSSEAFRKIIELNLASYKKTAQKMCGLDFEFDKSLKKVIFDEAVYPTHGTRPVFSTIHEMVKTKLPYIIRNICQNGKDEEASMIKYGFKKKKSVIDVIDKNGKVIDTYKFDDKLRLSALRASTNDEQQADTAVHESGHFVIYSYLNGKIPEKIVSRSVDDDMNGFMMRNDNEDGDTVKSKREYLNSIKVCLGGYVAEGLIFGEDRRSSGACGDLSKATIIASNMVRKFGMSDLTYVTTHLYQMENNGMLVKEENQDYINEKIKKIIEDSLQETIDIMKKPHIMKMLKASSKYLLTHSQMPKSIMTELLDKAREEGEICNNTDNYYTDIVSKF
jgi:energy-coupling factor transporter ATP-binding protein EcfA2